MKTRPVIRWVTKDGNGHYLRRGPSWTKDRWVSNPALATLDDRRGEWEPERGGRRVKVLLTATEVE